MNHLIFYTLIFFIYSFIGWIIETVWGILKHKRFTNKGLINGPFCIIYGISAVFITIFLSDLNGIWLFLFAMVWATVFEWISGHLIERLFHEKLWDYSDFKYHLEGYISVPSSLLWGILGYAGIRFFNPLINLVTTLFHNILGITVLVVLCVLLCIDVLASYMILYKRSKHIKEWTDTNNQFIELTNTLTGKIEYIIHKRIEKAYPNSKKSVENANKSDTIFAYGCDFYKIIWLFMIGAFLGDITETIFCRITAGVWMSRSSVVWGPFSIVWGLAIALATLLLYKYKDKSDGFLFVFGTVLGGAYEYLCSVFTEICFGKVFWDYSKIPFNLGGRINLLYCFFWGIAAVVWLKKIYPVVSNLIEKIPMRTGKVLTWLMIVFMIVNMIVSSFAMIRYGQREQNIPATNKISEWLDEHYNDEKMIKIYPNALNV